MIATWVVTAIHCIVTQSSSERCVSWRQNELFTRTLCHPVFLWTRRWGGTNFYLTDVCFQKLFTEFCFVWRSVFFLCYSFWWFVFYLCGCTFLSLWAREYTTYKAFIFSSRALSFFRSYFFFPLTKMFYFFIRRLWNSPGTTKWYEQVINFYLRLALQSIAGDPLYCHMHTLIFWWIILYSTADVASSLLMFDAEGLVPCLLQQVLPLIVNHADAETILGDPKVCTKKILLLLLL